MGFFDSLLSGITGGGSKQSSGFQDLPKAAQEAMLELTKESGNLLLGPNGQNPFLPLQSTADQNTANAMSQPMTAASVGQLASNYMNPFTSYLTNQINQQFDTQNSLYQQQLAGSGFAPGTTSNDFANEAALDQARTQAIGSTLANQYDTALGQGLSQNQLTIDNLMKQNQLQQQIYGQTQQAPVSALDAMGQLLGVFPQSSQGTSQGGTSSANASGILGFLNGGASSLIGDVAGLGSSILGGLGDVVGSIFAGI